MFETISPAPPDAILGLTEAFKKDDHPNKINLGVGVYQDATGVTPILASVRKAEERLVAEARSKSYLPISGSPEYGRQVRSLLLGDEHDLVDHGRAVTAHTPGGTGALRIGADFLRKFAPNAKVWVSSPTWANHKGIFTAAGFHIEEYAYYDAASHALDFEAMLKSLNRIPAGDVVLLHVCCHNPTGVDPNPTQWEQIAAVAGEKRWVPFLDFAYQGLGESIETDREPVLSLLNACEECLVASSFSKNFGLYQDRSGALTVVAGTKDAAAAVFSHIKSTIRVNYSNPPAHGGLIVNTVLGDVTLRDEWVGELAAMRERIKSMRMALVEGLQQRGVNRDFSFIASQHGMFSFSGLSDEQVTWLREKKSIYIVKGGRINVAGLTPSNIDYLCDAVSEALSA